MSALSTGLNSTGLHLENIQGNILGGFLKDHRRMLFLQFTDSEGARAWLTKMVCNISSSDEVIAFNQLSAQVRRKKGLEGVVKATWTNLAFTFTGLAELGVSPSSLRKFPPAFKEGMAARAADLGDTGASAPQRWVGPFGHPNRIVHALLLVEADDPRDLVERVDEYRQMLTENGTVREIFDQAGAALPAPLTGHEHFGFKYGVSQPAIRGVDPPDDPAHPDQGHPGQDLLHPGEFVLGYPTQIGEPDPAVDGPNPHPGPPSVSGPEWTKDGSYLVFRRLAQNVPAFHAGVAALTADSCIPNATTDLIGAKIVGRYQSGCPLQPLTGRTESSQPPRVDPGTLHPPLGDDPSVNNLFEYGGDPLGRNVPRAAHIRKVYPRDQVGTRASGTDSESRTQTHRLLRRGLPYGDFYQPGTGGGEADDERGLLFLCYQKDIEDQFEFVQRVWVNDPAFPCPDAAGVLGDDGAPLYPNGLGPYPDGEDALMAPSPSGPFLLSDAAGEDRLPALKHFVTTTGGDYFFSPSLSALEDLAADQFRR